MQQCSGFSLTLLMSCLRAVQISFSFSVTIRCSSWSCCSLNSMGRVLPLRKASLARFSACFSMWTTRGQQACLFETVIKVANGHLIFFKTSKCPRMISTWYFQAGIWANLEPWWLKGSVCFVCNGACGSTAHWKPDYTSQQKIAVKLLLICSQTALLIPIQLDRELEYRRGFLDILKLEFY